jgi:hypothetical protein
MAGQPHKKARVREGAQRRGKRRNSTVDVATRRAAVERAEVVGAEQAGREVGVAASTVRSWRIRLAARLESVGSSIPSVTESVTNVTVEAAEGTIDPIVAAERRVMSAWGAASEAVDALRAAVRSGKASDARNYGVSFGIACDKSERAERLLIDLRESRARVSESEAAKLAEMVVVVLCAVHGADLHSVRRVIADVMRRAVVGDPLLPNAELVELARGELRGRRI